MQRAAIVLLLAISSSEVARGQECEVEFDSTFEMIEAIVFEGRGCTSANCHIGPAPASNLDLSPGLAFENLFDRPVTSVVVPGLRRVAPVDKQGSLLWLNLASAVMPELWTAPLRPMPSGGLPPLSVEELDLVRVWIENGAPRDGVVPESVGLVDACLPPPRPLEIEPLEPPPPGVGIQLRAPRLPMPANSETEVCFVSYFDFSDQVPPESLSDDGKSFFVKNGRGRSDPLTHHQVAFVYGGSTPLEHPVWGSFTCKHGPREGEPCDPRDYDSCGEPGGCGSTPIRSVACIGYGPGDASVLNNFALENTMVASDGDVLAQIPIEGIVVWNSHSFNVTDYPGKVDRWLNYEFADAEDQQTLRTSVAIVDLSALYAPNVPAYGVDEICNHYVLPPGVDLTFLSFHTHKRGKRWRTFRGAFACEGGPNDGQACSPFGPDPGLPLRDRCSGARCSGVAFPRAGDCDRNLAVSIDELVRGALIALGKVPLSDCPPFDADGDDRVDIAEIVMAVQSTLETELDPEESLLYVGLDYADPYRLVLDPPLQLGGPGTADEQRTLTYCALYDNGFTDEDEVVRASRRPTNANGCTPTHCAEGRVGERCNGSSLAAHRSCDSTPGAGDGFCDACPARFGVTTDDEMFILIGGYLEPADVAAR